MATRNAERALQLSVSVAAAAPLVYFSVDQFIGYDGYWHVFIARQDTWVNFWFEVLHNAHPPLFYFLLGQTLVFGKTALTYRALGILAAIGSSFLIGRIVRRSGASAPIAMLVSVAFLVSSSSLLVGLEVRSYMLATFFSLIAFRGLLDLMADGFAGPDRTARLSFGLGILLALLTHYSAAFVLAACVAAPVCLFVVSSDYRRRLTDGLQQQAVANLATLALPVIGVLLVAAHSISYSGRLNHVPEFLYNPARQSAAAFLLEQSSNLAAMFVPFATGQPAQNLTLLALAAFSVLVPWRCARGATNPPLWAPAIATATIGSLLALAGLLGRYPYGGELRHQYVVFPFLVLAVGVAVGAMVVCLHQRLHRVGMTVLFGLLVAASAAQALLSLPHVQGRLVQLEMDRFRKLVPDPQAVYVDGFNLIAFFMHYDEWDWRFSGRSPGQLPLDLWRVSRGDQSFYLCRDRLTWMINLAEPRVYQSLNACRQLANSDRVALFELEQQGVVAPIPSGTVDPEAMVRLRASEAGMAVAKLQLDRGNVFAEFAGVGLALSRSPDAFASTSP
jgi:hypothetical protein